MDINHSMDINNSMDINIWNNNDLQTRCFSIIYLAANQWFDTVIRYLITLNPLRVGLASLAIPPPSPTALADSSFII